MSTIQVNQDFQLILETYKNVTAMTTKEIHYRKPGSKRVYSETATVVTLTKLTIDITDTINDISGQWYFQSYVIDNTGKIYLGEVAKLDVQPKIRDIRS